MVSNFSAKVCILFFLTLLGYKCLGQENIRFDRLSVEQGLSQISALSITQDIEGYVWIGTKSGLNKYDNNRLIVYKHKKNDTTSLSSNEYIDALYNDSEGTLWVGTSNGLNKYNRTNDNFRQIRFNPANRLGLSNPFVTKIFEDDRKNLWVGTRQGLNLLSDRKKLIFSHYLDNAHIYSITPSNSGGFWLGTSEGLVKAFYKSGNYQFTVQKKISSYLNSLPENDITALFSEGEKLWIGSAKMGLICYDTVKESLIQFDTENNSKNYISSDNVRTIVLAKNGDLWIGTQKGVNVLDKGRKKIITYLYDADNQSSLSQNSVYSIYQDKQNVMWIGTYYGGVNIAYPIKSFPTIYRNQKNVNSLSSNVVSAIAEDKNGLIWIGTEAEGLNSYDFKNKRFTHYKSKSHDLNSLSSNLIKSIYVDGDKLWIGTHQGGLNLFDTKSKKITNFKTSPGISSFNVNYVLEDSKKRFWVATGKGLKIFDKKNRVFSSFFENLNHNSSINTVSTDYIFEDRKNNIWVAAASGLYKLDAAQNKFKFYNLNQYLDIPSSAVTCINEDAYGNIWVGTYQSGIIKYDFKINKFFVYNTINGLPGDNVLGILEEKPGVLWLSTNNGLSRMDTKKILFRNLNTYDRLPGNVFNIRSFYKDKTGKMYFGSFEGMVSFYPQQVDFNTYMPDVFFTGVKVFNKRLPVYSYRDSIDGKVTKTLNLKYDDNVITVEFSNFNFIIPQKNSYAYYLDGFEKDWNYTYQPSVTYTNLPSGTYKLKVRARNNDGVWSKNISELTIKIAPPLWRTWWAYFIYIILFLAIGFAIARFLLIRALLKREKEVNQMKLDFFTNISHEIRTPLTLIIAPLEKILSNPNQPVKHQQLKYIKENADRLIKLVTELLDFRKTETGHLSLKVAKEDFLSFATHVCQYFNDIAALRKVKYNYTFSDIAPIEIFFDRNEMEKVLFNLLSNAFKFVKDGGEVAVKISENDSIIKLFVEDNGVGIPKEKQKYLFTQFFQVSPDKVGSGVGLALCKNIVDLHHGDISIESHPQSGNLAGHTAVAVTLRKGKSHFSADQIIPLPEKPFIPEVVIAENSNGQPSSPEIDTGKLKTILVVEDNYDLRKFIHESLQDQYHVITAENGDLGVEKAFEYLPDLILSDVMMPIKDGFELCTILKNDSRTDHIPIILLTAKVDGLHQITGAEAGADLYMAKPFSLALLYANIINLLITRETLVQKFSKIVKLEASEIILSPSEEDFVNKLMSLIDGNISNSEFNVPWLAHQMGMSQPILYKKLRAVTDLSVNDFIKSVRLKRAADLLRQKVYNISEIAYQVGFSDPNYFAKEFRKKYGMSPTNYIRQAEN